MMYQPAGRLFLSTLSLRRATVTVLGIQHKVGISIHALLAESDNSMIHTLKCCAYFYPRSPCGERPPRGGSCYLDNIISIHALLAESDTKRFSDALEHLHFYPRSPCGERPPSPPRARVLKNFYPRSPCGERRSNRPVTMHTWRFLSTLSLRRATTALHDIFKLLTFLSTLSLRRATPEKSK